MDLKELNKLVNEDYAKQPFNGEYVRSFVLGRQKPVERRLPDSVVIITFGFSSFLLGLIIGWILK